MENKKVTERKKKGSCFAWGAGCLAVFILITSLTLNGILGLLFISFNSGSSATTFGSRFEEIYESGGQKNDSKIAVISIEGFMAHEATQEGLLGSGGNSIESVIAQLKQAEEDDSVKAVVFDVNSPGGTTSAADSLYHSIISFKENTNKPIVASFGETAASGAYYVSAPADYIVAEPSSIVGSIGVIMTNFNIEGLLNKVGVEENVFKSGELKDIFSSTREMSDEEKEIIQGIVDDSKTQFEGIVKEHRPIKPSSYNTIFDSRVFTAKQAL
ncbi:signal peptide peptidase SppA, partial [Patescibacteria group bacterium]|nr:signal peptide peptidase SppA [Patescibacteria group bacterium]